MQWTAHVQAPAAAPPPAFASAPTAAALVPLAPTPMTINEPQRVDPYVQANPYGLPAVQTPTVAQPYVPMQNAYHGTAAQQGWNNQALTYAQPQTVGVRYAVSGVVFLGLSLVGLIPGSPVYFLSYGAIFAVIGGIRVLVNRGRGGSVKAWPGVVALVLGLCALLISGSEFVANSIAKSDVTYGSSTQGAQGLTGGQSDGQSGTVAQALPTPPTFAGDAALSEYEQSTARIVSQVYGTYNGGQVTTSAPSWPATLSEQSDGSVVFPSGITATQIPTDEVIRYEVSPDGKYFVIGVTGADRKEAAFYDSESNTFTWMCGPTAAANCPAGGIDPNSSEAATSNS